MASRDAVLAAMRRRAPIDQLHPIAIEAVVAAHTSTNVTEQPVAQPPPQTVAEVVAHVTASAAATECSLCGEELLATQDRTVRGRCRHTVHTACLVPLLVAGRQYCMECSPDHNTRTGYAIDTGNDADMRLFTVLEALRFDRDKVRDALVSSIAADRGTSRLSDPGRVV